MAKPVFGRRNTNSQAIRSGWDKRSWYDANITLTGMVEMQKNLAQSSSHIGANERFPNKLHGKHFAWPSACGRTKVGPAWNEPPAQLDKLGPRGLWKLPDRQHRLSRGDIVTRFKSLLVKEWEQLFQSLRRSSEGEAATHYDTLHK